MTRNQPSLALDPFSDEAIRDPRPVYETIRNTGAAVWLDAHEVWALGRYDDVRAALRADDVLVSSRGVALNDLVNNQPGKATLTTDGEEHRKLRRVMMKPMMPRPLVKVREHIEKLADALVEDLLGRDSFDGIADFSRHLPVAVVSNLVGLPEEGREQMLDWASGTFNALGPMNARAQAAAPTILGMFKYVLGVDRARLRPGSWAARVFDAADEGLIETQDARGMLIDYTAPSLDTTILATGHLLYLLGTHPDQYDLVRSEPERVPAAVHEALRVGSPVRAFTRFAAEPYQSGEVSIPEGDRALILYGSANLDERHYEDPERFDVTRSARDHLAFGDGTHRCAGSHLAQLEMECLLRAVVSRVSRIEVGDAVPLMSNMLHGHESFQASFR